MCIRDRCRHRHRVYDSHPGHGQTRHRGGGHIDRLVVGVRRHAVSGRGGSVNVTVVPTPEAACARTVEIVAALLAAKPDAVLALPAGNTPRPVYAELARRHREQGLSFARATAFSLDEYAGVRPDHPASFRRFMQEELYRHVDLPPE